MEKVKTKIPDDAYLPDEVEALEAAKEHAPAGDTKAEEDANLGLLFKDPADPSVGTVDRMAAAELRSGAGDAPSTTAAQRKILKGAEASALAAYITGAATTPAKIVGKELVPRSGWQMMTGAPKKYAPVVEVGPIAGKLRGLGAAAEAGEAAAHGGGGVGAMARKLARTAATMYLGHDAIEGISKIFGGHH